uniref:Uncharacterized protein n=1 Tax=Romanomermis culicivorax TaxID=13658 RepID=A0A915HIV7_ROMCU
MDGVERPENVRKMGKSSLSRVKEDENLFHRQLVLPQMYSLNNIAAIVKYSSYILRIDGARRGRTDKNYGSNVVEALDPFPTLVALPADVEHAKKRGKCSPPIDKRLYVLTAY